MTIWKGLPRVLLLGKDQHEKPGSAPRLTRANTNMNTNTNTKSNSICIGIGFILILVHVLGFPLGFI